MKRLKIHVSGVVQGVGFRYFTRQRANELGIRGYVANLPDGRVLVVAEGDEKTLDKFISALKEGPRLAKVTGLEIEEEDYTGEFDKFEVRY
ncbi:acylphosphatase [Geoglobus acetivorans]|uniref:Acylphosphatase n=1 Tax=Geoglobus acetivorans TaxID=565033 RepID=A0A0A7GI70_GEOAI|nr:Acylphosphate phosphohydrolase [Geoglobus acetivorans]